MVGTTMRRSSAGRRQDARTMQRQPVSGKQCARQSRAWRAPCFIASYFRFARTHGNAEEEEHTEIRQSRRQARRERDEAAQERHVAQRSGWKGGKGEESKAGDRHRTLRGEEERRQGTTKAKVGIEAKIATRAKRILYAQTGPRRKRRGPWRASVALSRGIL
jgi:hypothetical protein